MESPYGGTELFLVVIKQLDRELQGSYTLKLVARDSGNPPRYVNFVELTLRYCSILIRRQHRIGTQSETLVEFH